MTDGSARRVERRAPDWRDVSLWALLAVALLLQGVVLYAPQAPGESPFPSADKVVHLVVFAAPAALAVLGGIGPRLVVGVLAAHAVLSEVVQATVLPDRSGDPLDVVADLVGIGLGVAAVTLWRRFRGDPSG
ncbi:MAG: VanZ family protein [Ornithinibacter sp.]